MISKAILFCTGIYPPEIGGPATHVLEVSQRGATEGLGYTILTYSKPNTFSSFENNVIRIPWSFFLFSYFNYFLAVLRLGRKHDVIYLQGSFLEGIPTILANFFLKKRVVIRIGGIFSWEYSFNKKWTSDLSDDFLQKKQCLKSELLKAIDRFVISKCNKVIANSRYTKNLLISNGIPEEKIVVIYNPVANLTTEELREKKTKKELGLPEKKIILAIGRLVPWKNFDKLIEFSKAASDEFLFLIIGNGPEKGRLLSLIQKNNLKNKIEIRDAIPKNQLSHYYQIADAVVLISSFEGLSHVLLEAMQRNISIIASGIYPNKEALENYNKKTLIDINQWSFLDALQELRNNNNLSKTDLSKFDPETTYQQTMVILCES